MNRRRALFVSYHFPPSVSPGSLRMTSLVRHLDELGWDVTVITAEGAAPEAEDAASVASIAERVTVIRTARAPSRLSALPDRVASRLTRFPDRQSPWGRPLAAALEQQLRVAAPDIVVSSSPPHSSQAALARVRRRHRFRWISEFRDPWTAPFRITRNPVSSRLQRRMEAHVLSLADHVIANTPGNRDHLLRTFSGLAPDRVTVITNGYDGELMSSVAAQASDPADLVYVGEIYTGMLGAYVAALQKLRERGQPLPMLHVYGIFDDGEKEIARAAGFGDVVVHRGFVPWRRSLELMRGARALLLLLPSGEQWRSCVPSKLYPYLASGRPVFALVPRGDASAILEETRCGVVESPEDPSRAADALERFLSDTRNGDSVPRRSPDAIARYDYRNIAKRVDELMRRIAAGGDHGQ